jgi:hypothetical protein
MRRRIVLVCLSLALVLATSATAQLGKVLEGGGIAFVVSRFGSDINKFINGLTKTPNETSTYATKVVPIISAGNGTEVGAAQVMGPPEAIRSVQAVAQVEGNFRAARVRVRALVPVAARKFTDIKRVPGVGISGLIDLRL